MDCGAYSIPTRLFESKPLFDSISAISSAHARESEGAQSQSCGESSVSAFSEVLSGLSEAALLQMSIAMLYQQRSALRAETHAVLSMHALASLFPRLKWRTSRGKRNGHETYFAVITTKLEEDSIWRTALFPFINSVGEWSSGVSKKRPARLSYSCRRRLLHVRLPFVVQTRDGRVQTFGGVRGSGALEEARMYEKRLDEEGHLNESFERYAAQREVFLLAESRNGVGEGETE